MKNELENNENLIIDRELGLKLAGNKADFANDMLAMLVDTLPNEISGIHRAQLKDDTLDLKKRLHKLHGAVSYCGVPRLKKAIATFEAALKENSSVATADFYAHLEREAKLVIAEAQKLQA